MIFKKIAKLQWAIKIILLPQQKVFNWNLPAFAANLSQILGELKVIGILEEFSLH